MKKKYIYSIFVIIFLILVGYTLFFLIAISPLSEDVIKVKGRDGGEILVSNFYKYAVKTDENLVVIKEEPQYTIVHFPKDQGFIISLLSQPVKTSREIAEKRFLDALGITKEQTCMLRISLVIPRSVDYDLSGKNYHLSFCPNGIPFE